MNPHHFVTCDGAPHESPSSVCHVRIPRYGLAHALTATTATAFTLAVYGNAPCGNAPRHIANCRPDIDRIARHTAAFGKPVQLIDGDLHIYRSDNPLAQGASCATEYAPASDTAFGPFSWQRMIQP